MHSADHKRMFKKVLENDARKKCLSFSKNRDLQSFAV